MALICECVTGPSDFTDGSENANVSGVNVLHPNHWLDLSLNSHLYCTAVQGKWLNHYAMEASIRENDSPNNY